MTRMAPARKRSEPSAVITIAERQAPSISAERYHREAAGNAERQLRVVPR